MINAEFGVRNSEFNLNKFHTPHSAFDSLPHRIRPKHFKKRTLLLKLTQCLLYLLILYMPLNINKEDILPHLFPRRPGLYLCKVYSAICKCLETTVKSAYLILDRKHY